MLLTIAWRNIWRNRRRSMIVLVSIIVGVGAMMLTDGLSMGMIQQMLDNSIGSNVAHIQIHAKGFNDNRVIQNNIEKTRIVEHALKQTPGVKDWSRRVVTYGLLSSALNSSGGLIVGVEPDREPKITTIKSSLVKGTYLSGAPHEVVIGRKLAEKLQVGIGDKVVGMASALGGDIGSDLFRVVGIYETVSSDFDKTHMFITLANAQSMLELGDRVLEYAVITDNIKKVEDVAAELRRNLNDDFEVLTYADLLPMLVAQVDMYEQMMTIIYLIIGLAMVFGVINTMLMSVFERIQEFGVLMAIGMKNSVIFWMVMLEAAILGVIGTAVGLVLGVILILPLNSVGIDLSMFAESLTSFGAGAILYPVLTMTAVINVVIIIPLTTLLGAVYPALKATRLQPVTAIRYV